LERRLPEEEIKLADDHWIVLAPPGDVRVDVRLGKETGSYLATAPGSLVIDLARLEPTDKREVWFVESLKNKQDPDADENYFDEDKSELKDLDHGIELIGESGWTRRLYNDGVFELPAGRMTVIVHRMEYAADYSCRNLYARVEVEVGENLNVIELAKLKYQPYGMVDLVFKGRGSPEQKFDAWWCPGEGPRAPMLLALDRGRRAVELSWLSEHMPHGRLEFSFRKKLLPPGRYRLIPWPEAPSKYWREFTLKAGESRTVTVQAG
jgi:hypothetical protein